jgi:hypothetical protein
VYDHASLAAAVYPVECGCVVLWKAGRIPSEKVVALTGLNCRKAREHRLQFLEAWVRASRTAAGEGMVVLMRDGAL